MTKIKSLLLIILRPLPVNYRNRLRLYLRHLFGFPPIIIYQMGKVGSSTIYATTKKHLKNPVFHVHFLNASSISTIQTRYLNANVNPSPQHIRESKFLSEAFGTMPAIRWNIITLVREPVSAKLSHLFHNPRVHHPYLFDKNGKLDHDRALEIATSVLMKYNVESEFICNWLDREFGKFLGIDVYGYPFDQERGFQIIEQQKYKLLTMQMEAIDKAFGQALQDMGIAKEQVSIIRANENINKEFSEIYSFVKSNIKIPEEKVREIYSSKYAKHFYSSDFISKQIESWAH